MRIKSFIFFFSVLCFPLSLLAITPDQEITNRNILSIYVEADQKAHNGDRAENRVKDYLHASPHDADAWVLLSNVLKERGKKAEARAALKEAVHSANSDEVGRFHYLLANDFNRNGESKDAQAELHQAMLSSRSKESAEIALRNLKPGVELPPYSENVVHGNWSANVGLQAGYDSNVLLLSDSTLETLSLSHTQSPSFSTYGDATYRRPWLGGEFAGQIFSAFNFYTADAAENFNALSSRLRLGWNREINSHFTFGLQNLDELSFLNSDGLQFFNFNQRFAPEILWKISDTWEMKYYVGGGYLKFNDDGQAESNRRTGWAANTGINQIVNWKSSQMNFGFSFERVWAKGDNYTLNSYQAPFSWTFPLPADFIGVLLFRYGLNDYPYSDQKRRDQTFQPAAMLGRSLFGHLSSFLQYSYFKNSSNLAVAEYTKHTGSVLVNYAFQ